MKVAIVCRNDSKGRDIARDLCDNLQTRGIETILLDNMRFSDSTGQPSADLVFVLGGDGTLLRAARYFAGFETPILGVNLGAVGFLSSIEPENLQVCLDAALRREYDLDARIMIDATVKRDNQVLFRDVALNDVILRSRMPRAILVTLRVSGRHRTTYRADGVVCATPTGSTAYSLSAGGPVLDSGLDAFVVTPICPHLSSSRSLVVSTVSRLTLELDSEYSAGVSVDGQEEVPLMKGDLVQIVKSELVTRLVRLQDVSLLEKIKHLRSRQYVESSAG